MEIDSDTSLVFRHVLTIEPMINLGCYGVKILNDGWTAVTRDRSLTAQFQHTVGVTDTGVEIHALAKRPRQATV